MFLGINHIAMQIEGGAEELSQLYGRLLKAGAQIDRTTEHSTTLSVYFFDPDGNRLEIFAEKMSPEEGRSPAPGRWDEQASSAGAQSRVGDGKAKPGGGGVAQPPGNLRYHCV